jgi:hypothetical protein
VKQVGEYNVLKDSNIYIPESMVTSSEDKLIDKIYGDINCSPLTPHPIDYFLDHAILTPWSIDDIT